MAGVLPPWAWSRARTLRMNVYPSSPGISMSETSTSGRHVWSTAMASGAEPHVFTSAPTFVRMVDARSRACGSSSTTSTRSASSRTLVSDGSRVSAVGGWRSAALAGAPGGDAAAVQLHQVLDEGQAEAETAVGPGARAVGLGEAVEDGRQD